ncbi:MAG: SDR family oxidoreductase [Firmicutes bacterium]|nr:SDR family oxidoreductase [Bacillota bacterium]
MKKTALITGSSRGIGRATAELLAQNDYNIIINYFHSEKEATSLLTELKERGYSAKAYRADVSDRGQVEKLIGQSINDFGRIDVLVNNAGIAQQKLFTEITEDDWDSMININVKGIFNCCQCVLPYMIENKKGKIINVSSIWGITGASCEVHYSAAKAAVIGFTKALAKELGPSNIQVNCVAPGIIDTDMNVFLSDEEIKQLQKNTPLQRFGTVQEVAKCIFFLASEDSNFITGQVLSPNGGFVI